MGWASGFRAGSDIARQAIDTYRDARQRREFERIAQAAPEVSTGFTAQDGAQLEAMANARDAQGIPYYNVHDDGPGGLAVRSNFSYAGQDGQTVAPGSVTGLQPRRVTDFLGNRYDGVMTPQQIDRGRYQAYSDAIAKTDPVRGLQMRRELTQQEREDERFEHERRLRPVAERTANLQLNAAERTEAAGQRAEKIQVLDDAIAQLPLEGIRNVAAMVNLKSNIPMLFVGETKGKYKFLTTDASGKPGKELEFNEAQLRDMARGYFYAQAGYGREGQEILRGVSKELGDLIGAQNQVTAAVIGSENQALRYENADANERERLRVAAAGVSAQQGVTRKLERFVDPKGNVVVVDVSALPTGKDGTVAIPPGLRPLTARPEVTTRDIISYAEKLVENATPDPDSPNKPITMEKAVAVARAQLGGQGYQSAADRIVEAYLAGKGSQEQASHGPPESAKGLTAPRKIGTIVPPRSSEDMRPYQPMTELELLQRLGR